MTEPPTETTADAPTDGVVGRARASAPAFESVAPERLLVVPVLDSDGPPEARRYVLVRWGDWPQPAMLAIAPPGALDTLADAVAGLVDSRLGLRVSGPPREAQRRIPVRMPAPRLGLAGTSGWLRAVAAPVAGTPAPDALLTGCDALPLEEALAALASEVERMLLRDAAAALA